ncbi:nucleoid-associated protein [Collinsella sp. zg1085]|uniref:nucleoid-associated protein n=1 Tax=Collinsella sp. zg1085 TaxID=2844380 RepID=UPI001C0C7DE2|nr:nucleoid-associated protein [Collinsella sp. zg1085]QWT18187.1 nucleoid-associated protein [Collinsella sp. zg1085]
MNINHAILHILDFDSSVAVMSQRELDFETRAIKSYIGTHLRRARTAVDNRRAAFLPDSAFAQELKRYFFGERQFIEFSQQVAEFLHSELSRADKLESADVLVADFVDDDDARWFAVLVLQSKQAFMHEVGRVDGAVKNDIKRHFAILPAPSQKIASLALVRANSFEVYYQDKNRKIAGEDRRVIPDGLLACEEGTSGKETIEQLTRVVTEVAEEHGANTALALAKAKAALTEAVEADEELPFWDIVDAAFETEPTMREAAHKSLDKAELPERVPVERPQVERAAIKNHRIVTDTGISISFPAELVSNTDYIEFINEPNGLISIALKNIGAIENK